MSHLHAIKWCTKIIQILYIMHLIIKGKALWILVDFQVLKILARSIFSIKRAHNDTCISASNVSSFNRLKRSLFTQINLENPRSHIIVFANQSCSQCRVKVAESKLQELLEFENVCQSAKIGIQLCFYLQIATIIFCDRQFLERPSL